MQTEPPPPAHSKIVICFTQRSGSTMLCEDLTSAGIGRPNEWFTSWITGDPDRDWRSEADAVLEQGTANGIFGVKIAANQLTSINYRLATLYPPAADDQVYPHLRSFLDRALWIWMRREDTLGQAISHHLARKRGIYHVVSSVISAFRPGSAITEDRLSKLKGVTYEFEPIMQGWLAIQRDELKWGQFFLATGIEPYTVWYGYDPVELTQTLAKIMGVDPAPLPSERNLVKMPADVNERIRKLFLRDMFRG